MRVGMAQMLVEPGEPAANLARAAEMVRDAARAGCDVVVLPECLDLGWTHASARTLAAPIPGPRAAALAAVAREHGVMVAAGLVERDGDRLYNSAVLISAEGELLLRHRKITELELALRLYSVGTTLAVAPTALGVIGLDICADNAPASIALGQALGHMGAQVLLSPSAWAVPAGHDNAVEPYGSMWRESYTALATEYRMPVIGVSNIGPVVGGEWDGRRCIGCSLAVGPDGSILALGPYGEAALLTVTVPLRAPDDVPPPVRAARSS
jgi:predicted amidohydrolase